MVEDGVEPESDEESGETSARESALRLHNAVARVRDAKAGARRAMTPVVILADRDENDPLPQDPGLYLFKDPNCLGKCAKVRGRAHRLRTYFSWNPQSAYAVGGGALWRNELTSKTLPDPDEEFPPEQINSLDFIPKAAEKR